MLSGVNVIILTKQKDDIFKSTPFYLHFSKKTAHKLVSIRINDALIPQIIMKLDDNCDGYFLSTEKIVKNMAACAENQESKNSKGILLKKNISV